MADELMSFGGSEKELFDISVAKEEYSEERAYCEGIKYYLKRVKKNKGVAMEHSLNDTLKKFEEAFLTFMQTHSSGELYEMEEFFDRFYPDGVLDKKLQDFGLKLEFDSISEYLMNLKKIYF